eukprot:5274399-Pyramimonas_sp.AAC.1
MDSKRHVIGPCRVSLSNRLPLLERTLLKRPVVLLGLIQDLEQARSLKKIPSLLNFEDHPLFSKLRETSRSELVPFIASVFYHCDLKNTYRSMKDYQMFDESAKGKVSRCVKKMTDVFQHTGLDTILRASICDHFRQTHDPQAHYHLPAAAAASTESMENFANLPATVVAQNVLARRRDGLADGYEELLALEDGP